MHKNTVPHTHICVHTTLKCSYTNTLGHKYIPIYTQLECQQILLIPQTHMQIFTIIPSSGHSNTLIDTSSHKYTHSWCPSYIPSLTLIKPLYKTQVHLGVHKYTHSQSHRHRYTHTLTHTPIPTGHRHLHSTNPQTHMKNTDTPAHLCASADLLKYTRCAPNHIQGHTQVQYTHFVCASHTARNRCTTQGASCAGREPAHMLTPTSEGTRGGTHVHRRAPRPLQGAHKHTRRRAPERACTRLRSLRPALRRGPGEARAPGGGGAHLGSAPGRGRRSVADAGAAPGRELRRRPGRSAAQRSRPARSGARSPGSAMVEAAPPGPGPLRRTFLVPEIKSLDQYDFSRAKAAASLAWVLRAAFGGAGTRGGRQVRRAGLGGRAVGTMAGPPGSPGLGLAARPGPRTLVARRRARGGGGAAGPAPRPDPGGGVPGERGAVCAPPGFQCGPCLARPPPLTHSYHARGDPPSTPDALPEARTHARPALRGRGELRAPLLSPPPPRPGQGRQP